MEAGTTVEYKCHAGLHCVVTPVAIEGRAKLAVIGGRAFAKSADYQSLIARIRTGDLQVLANDELFANIIFSDRQRIRDFAALVEKAARRFRPIIVAKSTEKSATVVPLPVPGAAVVKVQSDETLQLEVERLRTELEHRSRFTDSLQHFLERISSNDPAQTYESIISSSKDLLNSERASLLIFDQSSNELILKAAIGLATDPTTISRMRSGEGVSGEVIESGKALLVEDVDVSGLTPAPAERRYKTKSFISYPIPIAGRKMVA